MKIRYILLLIILFALLSLFIQPSVTGYVVQDRFLISDVRVSGFDGEIKVEQFDDYDIKLSDALYYFTIGEGEVDAVEIEFMVDSLQAEEISLFYFNGEIWENVEIEFVKKDGRFNYYKGRNKDFGLFGVSKGVLKKIKAAAPLVNKEDLLLYGLLPLIVLLLWFFVLSYGLVLLLQRISYRFYLVLKRIIVELLKFGLSFSIVILVLDLISVDKSGSIDRTGLIYYAVIPVLILSLLSDVILSLILWMHRLVLRNRVYKFVRNSGLAFVICCGFVVGFLYKFAPKTESSLTNKDILIFGLIPVVLISSVFVFMFYGVYVLARRAFVHE